MRRLIVCAFAVVALAATLFIVHPFAHAASKGAPIRPATTYGVQPIFDCWSAVTIIHPFPNPPTTTYYAHFGYSATAATTVPQSASYTVPTLSTLPPTSFSKGTFTEAYVPAFDPANLPTWFVGSASATVVKTSATECGGVH